MKPVKLAGLEPENVFGYFEALCKYPHGSGNEKAISDYMVEFAKEQGLRWIQDEKWNVIIFKDATPGYEDHEPLILQAHLDMVCQTNEGSNIDMDVMPVDLTHDGTYIFAKDTSLGADDCAGVALIMAVLAEKEIAHPPIEAVFTTFEECGMHGAKAIDLSMLKGKRLWNIDTFKENMFTAGCAGSGRATLKLPLTFENRQVNKVQIVLEGLRGGHSGGMIKFNHANANITMAKLLAQLPAAELISMKGGMSGNAIPRSGRMEVAIPAEEMEQAKAVCAAFLEELRTAGEEVDANITLDVLGESEAKVMSQEETKRVLDFILSLPNGLQTWDTKFEGLPRTSLNMGILEISDHLEILFHLRSSVNEEKRALMDGLKETVTAAGGSYSETGVYSAWEYREHSAFRDVMIDVYKQTSDLETGILMIHAGLECGAFSEKIPGLDCVSNGPNAMGAHTAKEKWEIASTARYWEYMKKVLKAL